MDLDLFRTNFPEFADQSRYPSGQLTFWASIAALNVSLCAWGSEMYPFAVQLYVAHEMTLAAQNSASGAYGGTPSTAAGPVSSKAVGGASISYDTTQAAEKDAGWWNLTSYGKQYIRLARMYGAGAIQL